MVGQQVPRGGVEATGDRRSGAAGDELDGVVECGVGGGGDGEGPGHRGVAMGGVQDGDHDRDPVGVPGGENRGAECPGDDLVGDVAVVRVAVADGEVGGRPLAPDPESFGKGAVVLDRGVVRDAVASGRGAGAGLAGAGGVVDVVSHQPARGSELDAAVGAWPMAELLHPVAGGVGDVDVAVGIRRHPGRLLEPAVAGPPEAAPLGQERAVGVELLDPVVETVDDVDVAGGRVDRHAAW